MLAYVFWHRPYAGVDKAKYEAALTAFHVQLSRQPPPGLRAAGSFAVDAVPWLGGRSGYEDWCLLDGSWAMDPLNAWAVTGERQAPHDGAAKLMEEGHGGLYTLVWGAPALPGNSTATWLTRPRGIDWREALTGIRALQPPVQVWRRQMVLGPAPEFALVSEGEEAPRPPSGWQSLAVRRTRLRAT